MTHWTPAGDDVMVSLIPSPVAPDGLTRLTLTDQESVLRLASGEARPVSSSIDLSPDDALRLAQQLTVHARRTTPRHALGA